MQQKHKKLQKLKILEQEAKICDGKTQILQRVLKKLHRSKNSYLTCSKHLRKSFQINDRHEKNRQSPDKYDVNNIPLLKNKFNLDHKINQTISPKSLPKNNSKIDNQLILPAVKKTRNISSIKMLELEQQINNKRRESNNFSLLIDKYKEKSVRKSVNLCYFRCVSQIPEKDELYENTPKTRKFNSPRNNISRIFDHSTKIIRDRRILKTEITPSHHHNYEMSDLSPWEEGDEARKEIDYQ